MGQPYLSFNELIRSRAYRILRGLPLYKAYEETDTNIIARHPDDQLIGIYQNSVSNIQANIFISQNGIYFYQSQLRFIGYDQMINVKAIVISPENKRSVDKLVFETTDGELITLQFINGTVGFADAWAVLRFFMRVIADRKKR